MTQTQTKKKSKKPTSFKKDGKNIQKKKRVPKKSLSKFREDKKHFFFRSKSFYLRTNRLPHFLLKKMRIKCPFRQWKKYKYLIRLRKNLKSIPVPEIGYTPWWKMSTDTQRRASWLTRAYEIYHHTSQKYAQNFLKSILGSALFMSYQQTYITQNIFFRNKSTSRVLQKVPQLKLAKLTSQIYLTDFMLKNKLNWLYNSVRKQKTKRTSKDSNKFYQLYWMQERSQPWLNPLIYKKSLYNNMVGPTRGENKWHHIPIKIKKHFQNKPPAQTKRMKLYWRYNRFFANAIVKSTVDNKKRARMQQIMTKVMSGFYGHFKPKQFSRFWKKNHKKKSVFNNHTDMFLNTFEARLDVLVYRLNLAPTILWARRLIWEGCIFINNLVEIQHWTKLHSSLKIYAFPLVLKDPNKLYSKFYWNPCKWYTKAKFFVPPIQNEAYIVKAEEIIQYNPLLNNYKFKFKSSLFSQPLHKNILTQNVISKVWNWKKKAMQPLQIDITQQETNQDNASYFVQTAQHSDFNNKQDRTKEIFLNWIGV